MNRLLLVLFIFTICHFSYAQDISIGVKDTVDSQILSEERVLSIYLPPSYYSSQELEYPVLYILDGDYNFKYVSGLLELECGISERIPEMILVAVSGKGTESYRHNCRPNIEGQEDKGNADEVADFMEKELIPYINGKYKSNGFNILGGHSIGGLFVVNTALNKPELFEHFIAISPSLWWGDKAVHQIASDKIKSKDFNPSVYVSLANEPGMEVDSFLAAATSSVLKNDMVIYGLAFLFILIALFWGMKKRKILGPILLALLGLGIAGYLMFLYFPQDDQFKFKKFNDENHNSVGLPTYLWALQDIFDEWEVEKQYFSSADEMVNHYTEVESIYGSAFNIPNTILGYTYYILQDNPEELDKVSSYLKSNHIDAYESFNIYRAGKILAESPKESVQLVEDVLEVNSHSSEAYHALAKTMLKTNMEMADSLVDKSLELAVEQGQRQWKINEIVETKNKLIK